MSYAVQVRAYDLDDNAMSYYWNIYPSSNQITLNTCTSNAPSSLKNNYDYDSVRNYSSWITFRASTFTGLSESSTNYINLYYSEKYVPPEPDIPSFDVDTVTPYGFDINVYDTSDYPWVRYAVYIGDTSTIVLDEWVNTGGSFNYYRVTGLQPSTRYRVNVYYATSRYAYDGDWIGTQYHYTNAAPTYNYYIYYYDRAYSTSSPWRTYTNIGTTAEEITDSVRTPSRQGYTFGGWYSSYSGYSGTGTCYAGVGEAITLPYNGSRSLTTYAKWTINSYTLTASYYDSLSRNYITITGGGSYNYGTTATLRATITDSDNFEFVGWYDSDYNLYSTSTAISVNVTENMTFYARAKRKNFTLSVYDYYAGSAHYRGQYTLPNGTQFDPSVYSSPPSGYQYNHAECPQGTVVSSVTMNANKSLYLYYDRITYSANAQIGSGYSGMISSVSANPTTVNSGGTSVFTAVLVSGYEFLGWYDANGNQVSTDNPYTATITANTTLYARAFLSPFSWTYSHGAGTSSVSKAEWRRLQTFINRKRMAAGQSAYSFSAFKGYVTPTLFNEAAEAIGINDRVSHGEAIHRSHFTRLATAANNM